MCPTVRVHTEDTMLSFNSLHKEYDIKLSLSLNFINWISLTELLSFDFRYFFQLDMYHEKIETDQKTEIVSSGK
jgi:hypothetical protein